MGELRVILDGVPMPAEEALAFWRRFSEWMEGHVGDLAGFAAAEGLQSVRPELHGGAPVLVASRSKPQAPYATAVKRAVSAPKPPKRSDPKARRRIR
jgi:hypothetical protein